MKKMCAGLLCFIMLVAFGFEAFAADWREGKKSYRSVCMSCHKTRGEAGRLALDIKTQDEWSTFFAQEPDSIHLKVWGKLSSDDIGSLEKYFRKYAKDVKDLSG